MISAPVSAAPDAARLRLQAQAGDPAAVEGVARQFEAYFIQQMLQAMRAGSSDPLAGEQSGLYRDLFDQNIAQQIAAGRGLGLAQKLREQLQRAVGSTADAPAPAAKTAATFNALPASVSAAKVSASSAAAADAPTAFISQLLPHARRAAQSLGVSPQTLIAQAALETGWGRHLIQSADGHSSLNFFNIKADKSWTGRRIEADTEEVVNGNRVTERSLFRAYGSVAEAFDDYVRFIQGNPRYREALAHGGDDGRYIRGLQAAGYATDPAYADKVRRVQGHPLLRRATLSL